MEISRRQATLELERDVMERDLAVEGQAIVQLELDHGVDQIEVGAVETTGGWQSVYIALPSERCIGAWIANLQPESKWPRRLGARVEPKNDGAVDRRDRLH